MEPVVFYGKGDISWGYQGPGWYFWDETWSFGYGPYPSKALAQEAMSKYLAQLELDPDHVGI